MSNRENSLLSACHSGDFHIKELLSDGAFQTCISPLEGGEYNYKDCSALCVAASLGDLERTKQLLQDGADVNYRCKRGESALFIAACNGHLKIVECLLQAGAKVTYTIKSGDNAFLENWEVFTQVVRKVYPRNINEPEYSNYKAIIQLLLECNTNGMRPSILYEVLYCSLTVFNNPIAVYCVGVYSELSSEHQSAMFFEDNFLISLCHAFEFDRYPDFLNTVHCILLKSKRQPKEVVHCLVNHFNWADLVRKIAAQPLQNSIKKPAEYQDAVKTLFLILNVFTNSFAVRSNVYNQFLSLSNDEFGKVGRLIKSVIEIYDRDDGTSNDCVDMWHFLFFLLKQLLRENQKVQVARLLLRSTLQNESTNAPPSKSYSAEFERMVMLRSVEEDIALAHMLIDYGIAVNGECFVNFARQGHVDLVDRCACDKEVLFSKEVQQLLQTPVSQRNAANRNMRRCMKVIKSHRNAIEKLRSENEKELLMGDVILTKPSKKKPRQRSKKKEINQDDDSSVQIAKVTENQNEIPGKQSRQLRSKQNFKSKQHSNDDKGKGKKEDDEYVAEAAGKRNSRKRKKNNFKPSDDLNSDTTSPSETASEDQNNDLSPDACEESPPCEDSWKEVMLAASRRRRQSSSSSDVSTGPRKSVHFSHPIAVYENTKATAKSRLRRLPSGIEPMASSLKLTAFAEHTFDQCEAYRTSGDATRMLFHCDSNSFLAWLSTSKRWAARFEDLSEKDGKKLKQFPAVLASGEEDQVHFCETQHHLNVGSGPDYSCVYLGLLGDGREVSIKKVVKKRTQLLHDQSFVERLINLDQHECVSRYYSVLRDRGHYYLVQDVGEYSLEQLTRKKMAPLPMSKRDALKQLTAGLAFLHDNGVQHMAIKPSNVMLGGNGKLRLSDYGIHLRNESDEKKALSPNLACLCWMVTEGPCRKPIFTKESDVKCLGMVFFYILTGGGHPYGKPGSLPGECVQNISKNIYDLLPLPDPFAQHLISSMLTWNESEGATLKEVELHPFFWNDDDKDVYFSLLIQLAVSGGSTESGVSISHTLEAHAKELMDSPTKSDHLLDVDPCHFSSFHSLVTFLHTCLINPDVFSKHANPIFLDSSSSPSRFLRTCFPRFLLVGYKLVSWDDLESALLHCDIPPHLINLQSTSLESEDPLLRSILGLDSSAPVGDPEAELSSTINGSSNKLASEAQHHSTVTNSAHMKRDVDGHHLHHEPESQSVREKSDVKGYHLRHEHESQSDHKKSDVEERHLHHEQETQSHEKSDVEERHLHHELESQSPSLLDEKLPSRSNHMMKKKKQTNLCLSSTFVPKQDEGTAAGREEDEFSPSDIEKEIMLGYSSSKELKPSSDRLQFELEKSTDDNHGSFISPVDWIEVGSPLLETHIASMSTSAPIDLRKSAPEARQYDVTSVRCSVDECYDFGKYVQNWAGSPDVLDRNDPPTFPDPVCAGAGGYTNLDELD